MYRKRFYPQMKNLPDNYCGWAAEVTKEEPQGESPHPKQSDMLPCPKETKCAAPRPSNITDLVLIGALILLLLTANKDGKPDLALIIPLGLLLFAK